MDILVKVSTHYATVPAIGFFLKYHSHKEPGSLANFHKLRDYTCYCYHLFSLRLRNIMCALPTSNPGALACTRNLVNVDNPGSVQIFLGLQFQYQI